jgi:type IV secretory pathway TrbL component
MKELNIILGKESRQKAMKNLYPIYKNTKLFFADIVMINACVLAHEVLHPVFGVLTLVIMMFLIINTTFMMAIYSNKELNRFWKSKGTLDIFIKVNKNYMGALLILLALVLFIHTFIISCAYSGSISMLAVYIVLTRSWIMICHYFEAYKNTYSDRVLN